MNRVAMFGLLACGWLWSDSESASCGGAGTPSLHSPAGTEDATVHVADLARRLQTAAGQVSNESPWALIELDGVYAVLFRPERADVIDAGVERPLQPSLVDAVIRGWDVAVNGPFVRIHGSETGATRGAVIRGNAVLDPPEANSATLWTLECVASGSDGVPRFRMYLGDPSPSVSDRLFAIGGLEALVVDGVPTDSPTFLSQLARFGSKAGNVGRTWFAWDDLSRVGALVVNDSGYPGPHPSELRAALAAAGFDLVVMLDGGPSSALVVLQEGEVRELATSEPPQGMQLRFGLAIGVSGR